MLPCPRRAEVPHAVTAPADDHWRDDQTCSFCGSLSPDEFMRAVEAGARVHPTDKNYKAYLDLPDPDAGKPRVVSRHSNPDASTAERYKSDPTWRQVDDRTWEQTGPTPLFRHAKFYFQHLSEEQCKRLVELLNAGKVTFADPGRFYVLPFFISKG